jgi:hypothetical protein
VASDGERPVKRALLQFGVGIAGFVLVLVQWPFRWVSDALDMPLDRLHDYAERHLREPQR